jgi:uncharacterized protein (TIGR03382 family)
VIGTRGPATLIKLGTSGATAPNDFSEGIAQGDTLEPASLYEDQLVRRQGVIDPPGQDGAGDGEGSPTGDAGAALDDPGAPVGCGCSGGASGSWLFALLVATRLRRR